MTKVNIKYIENFLEEVEALYEADDGEHYPQYLNDMIMNIRLILLQEKPEVDKN